MLQDHPIWARITARLHIIIAILVALAAAAVFGLSAGEGDFMIVGAGLFLIIMMALMSQMGSSYWMVLPFVFASGLSAIPVGGKLLELQEIVTPVCMGYFIIQYALRAQKMTFFRMAHVPVQLYTAWALIIYLNNPVGLAELGSALGGLRQYGQIGLGFIAFMILANQRIGERESGWILLLILGGSFLSAGQEIFFWFFPFLGSDPVMVADPEAFYTWQQALAGVPGVVILLMFSRYRSRQIFSFQHVWLLGLFLACVALIAVSGKRAAVATIPLIAVTAAFVRKEFGFVFLWLAGAVVAGAVVIAGQGTLFNLPLTAQRALSYLPAAWDSEIRAMEGGQDDFRGMLRLLAREKIERNPWIGTGYGVDKQMVMQMLGRGGGGLEGQVLPYALGSAWHNAWLGYAADFGIPASVLLAIIYLTVLTIAWKTYRDAPPRSLTRTLALYIFFFTLRDVSLAHTSGHSALDAYSRWWLYGALVSLWLTNRERRAAEPLAKDVGDGRTLLQPAFASRPARLPAGAQRRSPL